MKFLNWLFYQKKVVCPRCVGKGHVDTNDIKRLQREPFWVPGCCAYCNGKGKVAPQMTENISADFEYLTNDLPSWERKQLLNGDKGALKRAKEHEKIIKMIITDIEHLYYIENHEAPEIAEEILNRLEQYLYTEEEIQEMIAYIEKVIKSKLHR